jgi:hypothetical protein
MRGRRVTVAAFIGVLGLAATGVILLRPLDGPELDGPETSTCRAQVLNSDGEVSSDLQTVIDGAGPGDTIELDGECEGDFTVGKDLTIRSASKERATLDGSHLHRVLTIMGSPGDFIEVTLRGLRITGGFTDKQSTLRGDGGAVFSRMARLHLVDSVVTDSMATGSHCDGGGIYAQRSLILTDSVVRQNSAYRGGGIFARHLVMEGRSVVSRNSAQGLGGGVWSWGSNRIGGHSQIAFNTAGAGGGLNNNGESKNSRVRMTGSASIHDNIARHWGGGGVYSYSPLTLRDRASIAGNVALGGSGGGVSLQVNSAAQLRDQSAVTGNMARRKGGGIAGTDVRLSGAASVSMNVAHIGGGIYSFGGIVEVSGHVSLHDRASVTRNMASETGGGVYAEMTEVSVDGGAAIVDNTPDDVIESR